MKIKRIDHIVITTEYPEDCTRFYSILGFTPRFSNGRIELHSEDFKINVHIKGNELHPHAGRITPGSADLCFEIEGNLDDVVKEIKSKSVNIELEKSPRTGAFGSIDSVYLRDPDGNLVELCQYQ